MAAPDGTQLVVTSAADGPGLVALGPDIEVRSGPYTLAVEVSGSGPPTAQAGTITVRAVRSEVVLAQRAFLWAEAGMQAGARTVELSFLAPPDAIRVEIESRGTGELALGAVRATPAGTLTPASAPVRRDVPLALSGSG